MDRNASVLVCDDEELIRWSLAEYLRGEGYRVIEAADGLECLDRVSEHSPDIIVTDLRMPRMDGMELIRTLRQRDCDLPVIVITAHGAVESAVEATRLGARAYLAKPFDLREVGIAVGNVLESCRLENEVRYLRQKGGGAYGRILGESQSMRRLFHTLERIERVDAPTVLLSGESGTGKNLVARAIHEAGPRRDGPLMEVDCASLPEQLIESELFGHERGAFTDARSMKRGLLELARGGTVLLDEIAEMVPATQARLLRAIESRRFRRVGGTAELTMDAAVIAATNRDLAEEVRTGRFREDLFFRLNVIRIEVPPLRERRADLPHLVEHFVQRFNRAFGRQITGISEDAMRCMEAYSWPGNVRELRNVVERIVILEADDVIRAEHLPGEIRFGRPAASGPAGVFTLPPEGVDLEALERSLLFQAIERTEGNQSAAARLLGISRYALRYRLEKYGLTRPR